MKFTDIKKAHHRNGVSGESFDVVMFTAKEKGETPENMLAVVFEGRGNIAVFNLDKLAAGEIAFGVNSYRGDHFEDQVRAVVAE